MSTCGWENAVCAQGFDLRPIAVSSGSAIFSGNTVEISGGPVTIEFEVLISGWGAITNGIRSGQCKIDGSGSTAGTGYCNGVGADLKPVAFPGATGCPSGRGCGGPGNPPNAVCRPGGFISTRVCSSDQTVDCANDLGGGVVNCQTAGLGFCIENPRYFLAGFNPISPVAYPDTNYEFSGVSQSGSVPDPGVERYFGTIVVEVPVDAAGTYTIDFVRNSLVTFFLDENSQTVPFTALALNPGSVTVPTGRCCFNDGLGGRGCKDGVSETFCATLPSPRNFVVGETCASCGCATCLFDAQCDDGDACTTDRCELLGCGCVNEPNFNQATFCCDPVTGGLTRIDDGDDCTVDVCDPGNGGVVHGIASAGAGCDDRVPCTINDICDGTHSASAGGCAGQDVNTLSCTTDSDCGVGHCDLGSGLCVCVPTSVCVEPVGGVLCYQQGELVDLVVHMDMSGDFVSGAQFQLDYDPTCLNFVSIGACAGSLFTTIVQNAVNEITGTIAFSVLSDPMNPTGTLGPADLACLSFNRGASCGTCDLCFVDVAGNDVLLTAINGNKVAVASCGCSDDLSLDSCTDLGISTPKDGALFRRLHRCLTGPAAAVDSCCQPLDLDTSTHVDLADYASLQSSFEGP